MIDSRILAIALAVLVSAPVVAATQTKPPRDERAAAEGQRVQRAKERCRQNHGVDCNTPEGLQEWLLQERSREEAVREGSRHKPPPKAKPAPLRP